MGREGRVTRMWSINIKPSFDLAQPPTCLFAVLCKTSSAFAQLFFAQQRAACAGGDLGSISAPGCGKSRRQNRLQSAAATAGSPRGLPSARLQASCHSGKSISPTVLGCDLRGKSAAEVSRSGRAAGAGAAAGAGGAGGGAGWCVGPIKLSRDNRPWSSRKPGYVPSAISPPMIV